MSRRFLFPILIMAMVGALIAKPQATEAEDARALMNKVTKAVGAEGLKTLRYTGTGSSYIPPADSDPASSWTHAVMKSYVLDLNLDAITSHVQLVRTETTD